MLGEPRWLDSQRRVEKALEVGHLTREQLIEATGLTSKTVMAALNRAELSVTPTWPRHYRLVRSALLGQPTKAVSLIDPEVFDPASVGKVWQQGKTNIAVAITDTDMTKLSYTETLERLETLTAQLLGVVVALRSVEDAPEWRETIGLT